MAWLQANWEVLLVGLLAVDRVLITLFPNTTVFQAIANVISGLTGGTKTLK